MKVLFISQPARAFGEVNVVMSLATNLLNAGGHPFFLVSPLAAAVLRTRFGDQTFELGGNILDNQVMFWRIIKKYRPEVIVFSALHELLHPRRRLDCPLIDWLWLKHVRHDNTMVVFMDFIAHVPALQETARCWECASALGPARLRDFLRRLFVILPCPLNEPSPVPGRRGIPYRVMPLPLKPDDAARAGIRARFLGEHNSNGILILRSASHWQVRLANEMGHPLYNYLGDLLSLYLCDMPRPVTVVSVSDSHELHSTTGSLTIKNMPNLPPDEYEQLSLACDLLLTDNEIGYSLGKTVGQTPGLVFVNTLSFHELMRRETPGSTLRRILVNIERSRPRSIYPFRVFPLRAGQGGPLSGDASDETLADTSPLSAIQTLRLGRMPSSPYLRAEIFGGDSTLSLFRCLFEDHDFLNVLNEEEHAYLTRLSALDDGPTVLSKLLQAHYVSAHSAL